MINLGVVPHKGKELTGKYMYHFAEDYCKDLGPLRFASLSAMYDRVRRIPYRCDEELFPDSPGDVVEVVARPRYLLDSKMWPALDCKKKAILLGAWAAANGIPFSFLAVSEVPSKEVHHVMPVIFPRNEMVTVDATFPEYEIGQGYPVTYAEELKR